MITNKTPQQIDAKKPDRSLIMNDYHYILDDNKNPIAIKIWENGEINTENLEIWGRFIENLDNRKVAYDKVGDIIISTVFLGIDHSFCYEIEAPVLFETAIIKGDDIEIEERYTSYEKALEGHAKYKDLVGQHGD